MISWWIIPTIVTVIAVLVVGGIAGSSNPYAGMVAFGAAIPAAIIVIAVWMVCLLLKMWLS